jgi:hypothetical protein
VRPGENSQGQSPWRQIQARWIAFILHLAERWQAWRDENETIQ